MPEYEGPKRRRRTQPGTSRVPEQPGVPRQDRQPGRGGAPLRPGKTAADFLAALRRCPALTLVALLAVCVPLIPAPVSNRHWHGLRTGSFEAGASLLLVLLLARFWTKDQRRNWAEALTTLPLRFLTAFFCWGCLSAALAPAKPFAMQGLLQVGAGALVAVTVGAEARRRPGNELLLNALTAATLLVTLSGLALFGQGSNQLAIGLYQDHQLYGAVFTLFLPLMLALSLSPGTPARRLLAPAALLGGAIALGLSETRASWIGAATAGIVFLGLFLWARSFSPRKTPRSGWDWRQFPLPVIAAVGALTYFLMASPGTGHVGERMRTLTAAAMLGKGNSPHQRDSLNWRKVAWHGAWRMTRQKPELGWGIGCYPYYQHAFTGQGEDRAQIVASGATIPDEAHDSYLQIATETGLPGLFLWMGVLISTFALGIRALQRAAPGCARQQVLIGCLSALAGQAVDALANPGWQFGEVSLFLWIVLGLTVALSLGEPAVTTKDSPKIMTPPLLFAALQASRVVLALAVGAGLLWIIFNTLAVLPAPIL